jgi:hypothetical protein
MPDVTMKRCPQCGQRTTNLELAQCPYCRVALVTETGVPGAGLTREQAQLVARQILGSWKLWAVIIVLVAAGAWGVVQVSQRIIDARSKAYLSDLETKATNRLAVASAEIAKQVSNQIQAELRQPRVQAAMEQMARDRVSEAMSNSLWPSLEEFQRSLYRASSQLARSTNELAKLDKDIKAAETKVAEAKVPQPAAAATTAPATQPPAAAKAPVPSTGGTTKLTISTQTVMQNGQNYLLTIFFKPTSQTAIGPVSLIAGTFKQTARIANFVLVTPGQSQPMMLNETQDAAQLQFNVAGGDAPAVAIELTAPTIVRVTGDALAEELTLPVAADKMTLPALTR